MFLINLAHWKPDWTTSLIWSCLILNFTHFRIIQTVSKQTSSSGCSTKVNGDNANHRRLRGSDKPLLEVEMATVVISGAVRFLSREGTPRMLRRSPGPSHHHHHHRQTGPCPPWNEGKGFSYTSQEPHTIRPLVYGITWFDTIHMKGLNLSIDLTSRQDLCVA